MPDIAMQKEQRSEAVRVDDRTNLDNAMPVSFAPNARKGLAVLRQLNSGSIVYDGENWILSGTASSDSQKEQLSAELFGSVQSPLSWRVSITPAPDTTTTGGGMVEIATAESEEKAQQALAFFKEVHGELAARGTLVVQSPLAESQSYQVRLMTNTYADAMSICSAIKASGEECAATATEALDLGM